MHGTSSWRGPAQKDSIAAPRRAEGPRGTLYRMRLVPAICILLFTLCTTSCALTRQTSTQSGDFDYYILSLSWSPEFCYSHPASTECAQHDGFIVHGLWPQFRNGRGPEYCSHAPGPSSLNAGARIMPDPALVRHEWEAHGTCTGLTADAYFDLLRRAFESIHIPRPLVAPQRQLRASPGEIVHAFEQANPGLPGSAIGLGCRGAYLQSVNICLTKDLRPTPCHAQHGCRAPVVKITPVR